MEHSTLSRGSGYFEPPQNSINPINILRPRQNELHFADDIFKYTFSNENVRNKIKVLLKFVPKGQTYIFQIRDIFQIRLLIQYSIF